MAHRYDSLEAKRRILAACARLFIEKGYNNTRMAEILREADVSASTFQNIFRSKDGVLTEFIGIMFAGQFGAVKTIAANAPSPACVYALETALQLALVEMNENLRDVYVESYTFPETMELICRRTAVELQQTFGRYRPDWVESDYYEVDIGTSGMMWAYMARPCDHYFTLEKKIQRFLSLSLSVFHIPEEEQKCILDFVAEIDVRAAARQVMESLFASLRMSFEMPAKNTIGRLTE